MKEHIQDILVGGRPMTKLEQANKEIERLKEENHKLKETIKQLQEDIDVLTSDDDNDSVWLEELNM